MQRISGLFFFGSFATGWGRGPDGIACSEKRIAGEKVNFGSLTIGGGWYIIIYEQMFK